MLFIQSVQSMCKAAFHNALRVIICVYSTFSLVNRQVITTDYCHFKGKAQIRSVIHHIKSFTAVFGFVYVRLDVVKYPQGSNQVFKVKGNSLHYRQSIKKSKSGDCNRVGL